MQAVIDDLTIEVQALNSNVAAKEEELHQHFAIVDQIKAERDNTRIEMQMEIDDLTDQLDDLRSNVEAKDKAIAESMRKADELQKQLARVESSSVDQAAGFAELRLQRDASSAELVQTTDVLSSEISQLRSTVASKDNEIHQLNQNMALLREGREKLENKSQDLALKCNEALNQKSGLQSDISALLASREEMQQELTWSKQHFSHCDKELSEAVSSFEKEKHELTQLLAAANASVKEARDAAFAADEELDLKERKLEEVLSMLSQREEELFSRTQQVNDLKRQLEGSESSEVSVLLDTIEALQLEKIQLEELVAKAAKERDAQEQEHRKRMGEEQRLLIREAEGEMSNLRTVRDQLKSALAQSETALFALQQEYEILLEEKKRLESKSHESQKSIPLLESEVSRLKSVNLDLTIENKDLASKVLILRKENGSQDLKANEEVVKLTTEVSRLKAESFAARQCTLELQEAVRVSERRSQSYLDESESERQRRQDIESTVSALQDEIKKLRQRMLEKENAVDAGISVKLQEVEDLKKEIVSRDARIKKLEAVRLTKEQCAALKKIKEERAQFLEEKERYRRQLAESESEIASLRAQGIGSNRGKQAAEDITALRFEKDALETKLRKYLAYCKALEGDKSQIIDALRANKREVVDDDFVGAVVTFAADAKKKILDLTRSESELASQLKKVEQKCASLREEREKLRNRTAASGEGMPEKNRQVKYLEQENLQLMLDLKAVKKQLHVSRSELDALCMKDLDDNTEDFSNQMAPVGKATRSSSDAVSSKSSDVLDSTTEADKENVNHDDLNGDSKVARGSTMKHRFSRAKATGVREPSARSVGLGDAGLDDENTGECRQS
ncbi:hypothetical protein MHU86_18226 [Fragilaria crotonensis]|nr:hypothetical protein MHU86_18226 [Fragilaria crotonensis]